MNRKRLAMLALAGSILAGFGCASMSDTPLLSRFRPCSNVKECDACQQGAMISNFEGPTLPTDGVPPLATTPLPNTAYPQASVPMAPPPRIVPIPQANPMPYTPQSLVNRQ